MAAVSEHVLQQQQNPSLVFPGEKITGNRVRAVDLLLINDFVL